MGVEARMNIVAWGQRLRGWSSTSRTLAVSARLEGPGREGKRKVQAMPRFWRCIYIYLALPLLWCTPARAQSGIVVGPEHCEALASAVEQACVEAGGTADQ